MKEINIFIAGDFCPTGQLSTLLTGNSATRRAVVDVLKPWSIRADGFIVNLECPLTSANRPASKYGSSIKSSPAAAGFLAEIGVDLVTLANNHIMDYGTAGLGDTLQACEEAGIAVVGAALNSAGAMRIHYRQIHDRTLAVINMAEKEFGCAKQGCGGANPFDVMAAVEAIREARTQAQHVLLILHGGLESVHYPSPESVRTLRFLAEQGPTAIIRHHPHRVQGHEVWNGVPIFYSLGNFLFDWHTPVKHKDWYEGLMLELTIPETDKCSFVVHPFNQCAGDAGIEMLDGEAQALFMKRYHEWSAVCKDASALQEEWRKIVNIRKPIYLGLLTLPHPFLMRVANKIGLLRFLRPAGKKCRIFENILRCDTHREVLLNILEQVRKGK
jgi:hypothetical protein